MLQAPKEIIEISNKEIKEIYLQEVKDTLIKISEGNNNKI
jgi:hypothetical protein